MAITDIIEESSMIETGAPSIKYEGERPLKKQEMLMAGPDWYIQRMELLMDEYGYGYEEAGEIAYDSEKYYEVIGIDPGGIGDETRAPMTPQDKMMVAQGGRIGQMGGTGPNGLPGIPRQAPDGMEFDMRQNGGFQPLGAKEKKDDVPAMLAKNEFVFTADAVRLSLIHI